MKATDISDFRHWFGNSQVVDNEGNPLVVYRGSEGGNLNPGYSGMTFWTPEPKAASEYADGRPHGAVVPAYLSILNQYDLRTDAAAHTLAQKVGVHWDVSRFYSDILDSKNTIEVLRGMGHDGIVMDDSTGGMEHLTYVAFSPEQIKSAIGNNHFSNPAYSDILDKQSTSNQSKFLKENNMKNISVFVLAKNSQGESELLAYDLSVSEAQYDNGDHYQIAINQAEESGYESISSFDQFDRTGQQLLGKTPLYGDGPRYTHEIAAQADTVDTLSLG